MSKEKLKGCIKNQVSISHTAIETILNSFTPLKIPKGDYFLESGKLCQQMAYINSGYLRMYNIVDGKEITFWIGSEGKFITSLSSFVFQTSNLWNIQAVTDCEILVVQRDAHFNLCKTEPKWLEFDNILLANSYALLEQSMFAQLHTTAKQRFEHLLQDQPSLFKYVPLQYLASMLGIAPESLSRLRKNAVNSIP